MFNWGPTEREIWYSCVMRGREREQREKRRRGEGWGGLYNFVLYRHV